MFQLINRFTPGALHQEKVARAQRHVLRRIPAREALAVDSTDDYPSFGRRAIPLDLSLFLAAFTHIAASWP